VQPIASIYTADPNRQLPQDVAQRAAESRAERRHLSPGKLHKKHTQNIPPQAGKLKIPTVNIGEKRKIDQQHHHKEVLD